MNSNKKVQRLHRHLIKAVGKCLLDIFVEGYYADKVIEYYFKRNKKWGSKDRKFVAESVYEMVRWWRYLWFLSGRETDLTEDGVERLFFVYWYLAKEDYQFLDEESKEQIDQKIQQEIEPSIKQSYPEWIYRMCLDEIGEDWHSIAKALNTPANLYLRTNTLKTDRSSLMKALEQEGVDTQEVMDNDEGILVTAKKNVFQNKTFQNGWFEVQDIASQMVASSLKVKPGMRVVDACAGAGGKSLHLASLMENKGKIISMDIHEKKLLALKKRSRRDGVDIIETRVIESSKTIKRLEEKADALLLDVPCSGLGVVRRNPDSKWKISQERIDELRQIQQEILQKYSSIVKVGGRMVYATCSILPSENQNQVNRFLKEHPGFQLLGDKTLRPDVEGYDGFYIASLVRNS